MAGILPRELILEILSWLPVTSLIRFRCVSKTWKFLISDPYLVKLHLERSSRTPQILLLERQRYKSQCFLAGLDSLPCLIQNPAPSSCGRILPCPEPYKYYLFGSCNGLLSLHDSLFTNQYEEHWVCFWNPATNICSTPSTRLRLNYGGIGFHYDVNFGFGYDDRRDSYKVVAMVLDWSRHQMNVWVYCMGDVRWRRSLMTSPTFLNIDSNGYFLNGTINWIGLSSREAKCLSYDLNNDTCRCFSVPEFIPENSGFPSMGVLNDCLCVCLDIERTVFVVLALKDVRDEKSWSRLVCVSYETLIMSPYYYKLRILCMWGDLLLLACSNWDANNIIITFNLKENKIERTRTYYKKFPNRIFSCNYVPSLILPT